MKKKVFLFCVLIALIFIIPFAIAEDENKSKIDKAYDCLEDKVKDKCSSLSSEEKIFSLLAIEKCKDEIISDSQNNKCWPKSGCKIKTTAQAILALNKANVNTDVAQAWLLSQNTTPDINWYLQIESSEQTTCTITYSGSSHQITIGADKKINSNAGSCLSLSDGAWWLKISPSCYDKEFEIKCHDNSFLTNLLFKKKTSSTIHVSEESHTASAEASTYEKVNSLCFAQGGSCDYEGSLWAALVLDYLNEDISFYLPYLVAMTDENEKYLPESFLYLLTDEFRIDLLSKQVSDKYWDVSRDKFYDTALALYAFSDEPVEKTNSKNWLLEVQDKDGCWQGGNIRNTAFILYSIWPRDVYKEGDDDDDDDDNDDNETFDCEDLGYYCMSSINCQEAGGNELDYSCAGMFVCCDKEQVLETCEEQGGEVCVSPKKCVGGTSIDTPDLNYGETCCIGGKCEEPIEEEPDCEENFGICRAYECEEDEEESFTYTCDYGDICCVEKTTSEEKNYLWIWILLLLIFLVVLGIMFKDKLRTFWFRTKSKFGKTKPKPGPGFGFPPSRRPQRRPMPRRIFPPTQRQPVKRPPVKKHKPELDDVLKKLKEMGK